MSREKKYDRNQLLEKAIVVFRENGYHATGTAQLTEELGINKKTMYAEFGSKLQLFEATLEHYNETFLSLILAPIEKKNAGLVDISLVFYSISEYGSRELYGLGCLMCNTSAERVSLDACLGPVIDQYFQRIRSGFEHALLNYKKSTNTKKQFNHQSTAAFLTTTLIGLATSVRARAPKEQLSATSQFIEDYLVSLD
ncbi:MAG: TetR/AcrR family transcriptional regulator [Leptospiraceae bacterium]|nr:TetR/AcrR family transcriptional regulator [Leptospiraceae bacterium]MCP5512949.1 TetR/AcrR family transcriptional regulator [Leptospiraceae bacterium]